MQHGARPSHSGSLVRRLVRTAALWVVPALLMTAFALIWFYRTSTYRIFDDPLVSTIQSLIASVEIDPVDTDGVLIKLSSEPIDPRYQLALSGRYWLIGKLDESGTLETLVGSPSLYGATIALPQNDAVNILASPGDVIRSRSQGPDNEPLRLTAQHVVFPQYSETPLVIISAADSRPASAAVRQFALIAISLMSFLALALGAGILFQVRLGLTPLFALRQKVADVREGRASKVEGEYPSEIEPLANELNSLIQHNKDVVEYAQTHVANLAHALKTPIAVLKNDAESNKSRFADVVGRQTEIMSNQVEHHLRRARAATRGQMIGLSTPVAEILDSLARTLPRIYRDKDLDMQIDGAQGVNFRGEKRDLEEMIGNLMDNAAKWTAGKIKVSVEPLGENLMRIIVDDDGAGLPADHYETVMKRGARLDEATPGSGFGLSIVSDLAKAYKGGLALDKSPLGGLRAILDIPKVIEPS